MKLKFIKAQEIDKNVKATIHSNGKLGFSSEAARKLSLIGDTKAVLIGLNEDEEDGNIYIKTLTEKSEDAFNIIKAGDYFYVNTKAFFDSYNIDYKNSRIIYDIVDFTYEGESLFKFIKREVKKKKKKIEEES